ncbi:hypothetical protein GCM10009639_48810 [Kitasatospora putterlickiae]|uniref:Uncharacterized protein n=1 Tax=Kitasatospora putterlickiae TaxID=221725 RepID=A0ABN1YC34_9ACTN
MTSVWNSGFGAPGSLATGPLARCLASSAVMSKDLAMVTIGTPELTTTDSPQGCAATQTSWPAVRQAQINGTIGK